ncbi:MAG: hypothetical protein IT529_06635 [Burkholderiales bacterium]|nr:hypothetical protein [Burkholderiales bacterium]
MMTKESIDAMVARIVHACGHDVHTAIAIGVRGNEGGPEVARAGCAGVRAVRAVHGLR